MATNKKNKFCGGLKLPTVIEQLKRILNQYPDDGQILKELIQNAEDAGAKTVKFLYDNNTYAASGLLTDSLAEFQGEALYAYNDAVFTEEDWDGLRRVCGSVKEKDPMKVGRFGLGFKSIFHITDLPSVLSGDMIGFIDPQEKHLPNRTSTDGLYLDFNQPKIFDKWNQIRPFLHEMFQCTESTFSDCFYNGTLFRFPLRKVKSSLSQNLYGRKKITDLFTLFKADAYLYLLFLSNLESIEMYKRSKDGRPELFFEVRLAQDCLAKIREKRKQFISYVDKKSVACFSFTVTVESVDYSGGVTSTNTSTWLVTQHYNPSHPSGKLHELSIDNSLGFLPWVGVALPIGKSQAWCASADPGGHLFCFLPLPLKRESPTGFPFHVHGYFAVEENRRHIKWPGPEQDIDNLCDKSLQWNLCLARELLPDAVTNLVMTAIQQDMKPADVYSMIPNPANVSANWRNILPQLYTKLFQHPFIYTDANRGKWMGMKDITFCEEGQEVLKEVLVSAHVNVAIIPKHVKEAISYTQRHMKCVTHEQLSAAYRIIQNQIYLSREEKLYLLQYLLNGKNWTLLTGLTLLPLASGEFGTFFKARECGSRFVYNISKEYPMELFPGIEASFLSRNIPSAMLNILEEIARSGVMNLLTMGKDKAVEMIHKVPPVTWKHQWCVQWTPGKNGHPNQSWMKILWKFLKKHYGNDLSQFRNMHIILSEDSTLFKLKSDLPLIQCLPYTDINIALKHLGVKTIQVPDYVKIHPQFSKYVDPPEAACILKAMKRSSEQSEDYNVIIKSFAREATTKSKIGLRHILATGLYSYSDYTSVLLHLPIFETESGRFVSLTEVSYRKPLSYKLPVPFPADLLADNMQHCEKLFSDLGIKRISIGTLLSKHVLPRANELYSCDEFHKLTLHILENLQEYTQEDDDVKDQLSCMQIVFNRARQLVNPGDLFDPFDIRLLSIFAGQDVFPSDEYKSPNIIKTLKVLGLKTVNDITPSDVLNVMESLPKNAMQSHQECEQTAASILVYLEKNPNVLEMYTSKGKLKSVIEKTVWVPVQQQRPQDYPQDLEWYQGRKFETPRRVKSESLSFLIGSTSPITSLHSKLFDWNSSPDIDLVVEHFHNVIKSFATTNSHRSITKCVQHVIGNDVKTLYRNIALLIYDYLISKDTSRVIKSLKKYHIVNWIWYGDGFIGVDNVVVERPFINLLPYVYTLLSEMHKYQDMFFKCGMRAKCDIVDVLWQIKRKYDTLSRTDGVTDWRQVNEDRRLCIEILNHLKPSGSEQLSDSTGQRLLVPVHTISRDLGLKLAPLSECAYSERDITNQDDLLHDVLIVHPDVPIQTCRSLNIRSLTNQMLNVEELDMSYGQHEPLTRRLRNLLGDYRDGLAIPKELIQNADDAGATEVCFLYDERENNEAMGSLIDPGMKECHGPSLWVYNNATFSDEDFENITKLSGATKVEDAQKIGRFGLGFNAVYNLTDVPSFVSRDNMVILDPHTHHLGSVVRNKLKPGIKINIVKQQAQIRKWQDQFTPYDGVFGFHLASGNERQTGYDGTLFRFPLRTVKQASHSEISQLYYNTEEVKSLLNKTIERANDLLLFTQNVVDVKIYHLASDATDPQLSVVKIFSLSKQLVKICKEMPYRVKLPKPATSLSKKMQDFINQCSSLRALSVLLSSPKKNKQSSISASMIVEVSCELTESGKTLFQRCLETKTQSWLICIHSGTNEALEMARKDKTLVPVAGVAAPLQRKHGSSKYVPARISCGKLFCFMPLPIESHLPVHVNGYFAVDASRQHLSCKTSDDKDTKLGHWNELLMKDAACQSYCMLLEEFTRLVDAKEDKPFAFWPVLKPSTTVVQVLWKELFRNLTDCSLSGRPVYSDGRKWRQLKDSAFLEKEFRDSDIGNTALCICQEYQSKSFFIDIPRDIYENFEAAGCSLSKFTYSMERFYSDVLFPNIKKIPVSNRDSVVLYALHSNNCKLHDLIRVNRCIPISCDENILRRPDELVHPKCQAAKLFSEADGRFPYKKFVSSKSITDMLLDLGMKETLSWKEVCGRAKMVADLSYELRKERCMNLVHFINQLELTDDVDRNAIKEIQETPFLYASPPPTHYPISWMGENEPLNKLHAPCDLYFKEAVYLVGSAELILDEQIFPVRLTNAIDILKVKGKKDVKKESVLQQLLSVKDSEPASLTSEEYILLERSCMDIYTYVQEGINVKDDMGILLDNLVILQDGNFLEPDTLSFSLTGCVPPYLKSLKSDMARMYRPLFKALGVKEQFQLKHYLSALQRLKEATLDGELSSSDLDMAVSLLNLASSSMDYENHDDNIPVYIPDYTGCLQLASDLCYSNCPWFEGKGNINRCHSKVSFEIARKFAVKTVREQDLASSSVGIPFGQHEELSTRLKRILSGYPCDKEILNELLQNADDASATEIHFVVDLRHHGTETIFENSWAPLQGPSLCVYNNRPFTQADLIGIQKLGEGSKASDPNKTGMYGVGFNCVYHITDVPLLLTSINGVETMCVFDPNCHYMPGASKIEPGRRLEGLDHYRQTYKDVFGCFLEEHFDCKEGTIFRFPLRTKEMARSSDISDKEFSTDDLNSLIRKFVDGGTKAMLFLNHIERIKISEINPTGHLEQIYTVHAEISETDLEKREEFSNKVESLVKRRQSSSDLASLLTCPNEDICYSMKLHDSSHTDEHWLLVQQFGFSDNDPIPGIITESFIDGNLCLLPRGAVAVLLTDNLFPKPVDGNVHCFLPLPIQSNLPVQINGHFALDHESRRHLWSEDGTSCRSIWNETLSKRVLAPAYLALVSATKAILFHSTDYVPRKELVETISSFCGVFPLPSTTNGLWKCLATSFYQRMHAMKCELLPVLRKGPDSNLAIVDWFPPSTEHSVAVYFYEKVEKKTPRETYSYGMFGKSLLKKERETEISLKQILVDTGLQLIDLPTKYKDAFIESEVKVLSLTPSDVLTFYKSYANSNSICNIPQLPTKLKNTPFKGFKQMKMVIDYCKWELKKDYEGVPLLLTQNNMLRIFSSQSTVYASIFTCLFPHFVKDFVHEGMLYLSWDFDLQKDGPFKALKLRDMATMLKTEMPEEFYSKPFLKWKPQSKNIPNLHWLDKLWCCISGTIDQEPNKHSVHSQQNILQEQMQNFKDFCLIPAKVHDQLNLVAVSHAFIIQGRFGIEGEPLLNVLKAIGCPTLECHTLYEKYSQFNIPDYVYKMRSLVTTDNKPNNILLAVEEVLKHEMKRKLNIETGQAITLMSYFCRHLSKIVSVPHAKKILLSFPFFCTVNDLLVSLEGKEYYRIPEKIPVEGMDVWHQTQAVIFVKNDISLLQLYKYVECRELSVAEVYCRFIFTFLRDCDENVRMKHMVFLRENFQLITEDETPRLIQMLKELPFVPDEFGRLQRAGYFFDCRNSLFKIMNEPLPHTPFDKIEWEGFLIKAGLVYEITHGMLIKYAEQIAREAKTHRTEQTEKRSVSLVSHLFREEKLTKSFTLECLRNIEFIHPVRISSELSAISPQLWSGENELPYIKFAGSVPHEYECIVWTTTHLLPKWANPVKSYRKLPQDNKQLICEQLGINITPVISDVAKHCRNICNTLSPPKHLSKLDDLQIDSVSTVFAAIYQFLQENALQASDASNILSDTFCIFLKEDRRLVSPKQVVKEMSIVDEIRPYLYRIPHELGPYVKLFEYLGMENEVTVNHYARVLHMIQTESHGDIVHVNEMQSIIRAVRGLYSCIETDHKDISLPDLFLPTVQEDNRMILLRSSSLVFIDQTNWADRLKFFDRPFLENVTHMETYRLKKVLKRLPESMQVTMISDLVREVLTDSCKEKFCSHELIDMYTEKFASEEFSGGLVRWINHKLHTTTQEKTSAITQDDIDKLRDVCYSITFLSVEECATHLEILQEEGPEGEIPDSRDIVSCFSTKLDNKYEIYFTVSLVNPHVLRNKIEEILIEIIYDTVGIDVHKVPILSCPTGQEHYILDELRIPSVEGFGQGSYIPDCGSFIPVCEHHLLQTDFTTFDVNEYVGYEIDDPVLHNENGSPIYIYAQIVKIFPVPDAGRFQQLYEIKVNEQNGRRTVPYTDIYKFHRREVFMEPGEVVLYSGSEESGHSHGENEAESRPKDMSETLKEITEILEEAWKLPELERSKVIKRLILKWHPDKNYGNEEFSTEVFQYLQQEILRLEEGRPRDQPSNTRADQYSSYSTFFDFMSRRAGEQNRHFREYRRTFQSRNRGRRQRGHGKGHYWSGGSSTHYSESSARHHCYDYMPPSFATTNPQSSEADRWMTQATADLHAGDHDIANKTYEWACLKCFQAAEKALIACQYGVDANKCEGRNHQGLSDLIHLVARLGDAELVGAVRRLHSHLARFAADGICYPSMNYAPQTPNQFFTRGMAEQALEGATEVLRLGKEFLSKIQ